MDNVLVSNQGNPKTTVYCGGLADEVTQQIVHSAFIPFGEIKELSLPLDMASGKHKGFCFIEYEEREDAAAAMDNMHNSELMGKVIKVNIAQPQRIKGGDKGFSHQPVWADADRYRDELEAEQETV
jgi:peptidyl-prolyl isomerase E (cyclophilin E)